MNSGLLGICAGCLLPFLAWAGQVTGKVSTDRNGQELAGAMVHVFSGVCPAAEPVKDPPEFAVRGGRLFPEVLVVRTGETFTVKNADNAVYNVHLRFRQNKERNVALRPQGQLKGQADRPELFARVSEDLNRLNGYICVVEHSFYALTDATGKFTLPDLPPGAYTIEAVHPREGRLKKEVVVTAANTSLDFVLPGRLK
jgi:hypothetical protein